MKTKHTPGPWRLGISGGCVVSDSKDGITIGGAYDEESKKYYGGYLIAESISSSNASLISKAPEMFQFITEIQQALTDKKKGGTKLSVLEFSMLNQANQILNDINTCN